MIRRKINGWWKSLSFRYDQSHLLLNGLTSSGVHVSIRGVSSITRSSGNFQVKILCHYVSNCLMSLIQVGYYRCCTRQQIRKVIVLLVQSIDARSSDEERENWSMEADTERYCPYFSPYTSYSPYLPLWVLNCRLAISFAAPIYYTRTCYLKFESGKARLRFFSLEISRSEATLFVSASRAIYRRQLSRSTILSKVCPVHYYREPKYRSLRPQCALVGVCSRVSVCLSARHRPWYQDFRFQFSQGICD